MLPFIIAGILDVALGRPIGGETSVGLSNLSLSNLGAALFQLLGINSLANPRTTIAILSGIFLAVGTIYAALMFLNYIVALRIRVMAARNMQYDLFQHILGLSLGFFNRSRTGELVSRLDKDTISVTSSLAESLTKLLASPLLIAFYGMILLRTTPTLFIAVGAAIALHFLLTRGIQNPIRRRVVDQFSAFAALSAGIFESIMGIRVIKSLSAESYELQKLRNEIRKVVRTNMRYGIFKHIEEPFRLFINYFLEASILLFAGASLLTGTLDAATFILFIYVGRAMLKPIGELATALTGIYTALGASTRVIELFDENSEVVDGAEHIEKFDESICFDKVSFSYGDVTAVDNIDLNIHKGSLVALVGPSGAGKSTLADLLLRFYDPNAGSIRIDGHNLQNLRQQDYRKLFGVVPQEPLLFNTTIRENISYGREHVTDKDIVAAAKAANAHEFILTLPDGYETLVGDRGIRLSGGERQRIAIARALIGKPPIMVFDEATSSLDSESERLVQEAIDQLLQSSTALVIAHRLSTIRQADKIIVMEAGRLAGEGTHQELLESNELYKRLYNLQFFES